ncbi:YiiX/YebB-like N1pC/P60 family cysteine hydrolase [Hydrogenophaga sp. PAMC20947]|uniref:YiiX/YebB-like N1pC/P60 family cysteine hydrolase n=1 Tax=Hydrogenophaga sp. PAMC20947 TaxID=2565558 RepID=UPI00109D90AE|nr:YiiX/YebB-like N1pC/P60 family cysteine hydrolase [Hydrogenophaga sp. PAMC20947]QCB47096.1 lipo-like protein [Hydrogenophaga sp. PAMC20947]
MGTVSGWFGSKLARYLSAEIHQHGSAPPMRAERLLATLQPGDVLLVEGHSRFSTAIKFLTQSTWSHAALYVGTDALKGTGAPAGHCFVEADVAEGVRSVATDLFESYHTRICRPVGLTASDTALVVGYAVASLGHRYDLRNVWDLARYLLPTPPVPLRWRRRMLSLGSGDPTRAICSTLIAQAFQLIHYPILPLVSSTSKDSPDCPGCVDEILRLRHHSLFAPRDFDVSPYFAVIKPALDQDFDFHTLNWNRDQPPIEAA